MLNQDGTQISFSLLGRWNQPNFDFWTLDTLPLNGHFTWPGIHKFQFLTTIGDLTTKAFYLFTKN